MTAWADRGNFHPYPSGVPAAPQPRRPARAGRRGHGLQAARGHRVRLPHRPRHDRRPPARPPSRPRRLYSPRLVLEGFRGGVERTYFYQLADPWPDASQAARAAALARTASGCCARTCRPSRPSSRCATCCSAVDGDSAPVASPGGLRLGLEGAPPDVRQLLLRSADGSYALVLWRDGQRLGPRPPRRPVPRARPRGRGARRAGSPLARRFDPVASDAEQQRWANPSRIPVDLGGRAGGPEAHAAGRRRRGRRGRPQGARKSPRALRRGRRLDTQAGAAAAPRRQPRQGGTRSSAGTCAPRWRARQGVLGAHLRQREAALARSSPRRSRAAARGRPRAREALRVRADVARVEARQVLAQRARERLRVAVRDEHARSGPARTVSRAPPASTATTGRPAACASTAAMPNSSTLGTTSAAASA